MIAFSGCVTVGKQFHDNGFKLAAYELGCPEDKVTFTYVRGKDADEAWVVGQEPIVAVSGCGKRASYTIRQYQGAWFRREEEVETVAQ